jgi:hypothetical protein
MYGLVYQWRIGVGSLLQIDPLGDDIEGRYNTVQSVLVFVPPLLAEGIKLR